MKDIVSIKNLTFAYRNGKTVLRDICSQLCEGDIVTLLGPNGIGKSTLLNCIAGLLKIQSGIIKINGSDITSLNIKHISQIISYVPQIIQNTFDYTVIEYVTMGRTAHKNIFGHLTATDYRIAAESLEKLDILHLQTLLFNELSGGEQQQVCIARALAQEPKLIVLDEPTSALDLDNQIKVLRLMKKLSELGYAVLMTTHNPEHSLLLNSIVWILGRNGHLLAGSADELITEKVLRRLFISEISVSDGHTAARTICFVNKL